MAYLLYSAINREGQSIRRLGQYAALQDLDKELHVQGEELLDFHLLSDGVGKLLESLRGKPKPLEIAEFCTTLSHYVAGGVELQGALSDAAQTAGSTSMRTAIIDIRRHLKGGYTLSQGMRMTGRFPDVVISMARIGEESGNLARMLKDAAQHLERVEDIKGAAKRAMVYPSFTFLVVAAAARRFGAVSTLGALSHALGAGLLVTIGLIVWLEGPVLVVGLAAQAVITLVVAGRFDEVFLKINGMVLAGVAWLLTVIDLVDIVSAEAGLLGRAAAAAGTAGADVSIGADAARGLTVGFVAVAAWLVGRRSTRNVASLLAAPAWVLILLFPTSLIAPVVTDRSWLVVGAVAAVCSLAAGWRLGPAVSAIGGVLGAVVVTATAAGLVDVAALGLNGELVPVGDHLAHLAVVVALAVVTAPLWWFELSPARRFPGLGSALFTVSWVLSLGWLASVLAGTPQAQVAISGVWAVAACGAIVVGLLTGRSEIRTVGLVTLGVVLVNLLTVDLAEVETLWRVGLFLVIGLGLLRLGYVLPALAARYVPDDEPTPERPVRGA